jgi:hypothetical protein
MIRVSVAMMLDCPTHAVAWLRKTLLLRIEPIVAY